MAKYREAREAKLYDHKFLIKAFKRWPENKLCDVTVFLKINQTIQRMF